MSQEHFVKGFGQINDSENKNIVFDILMIKLSTSLAN